MGTNATKQQNPEKTSWKPVYEGLLKDFAQIVQVTSCPDLFSYRLTLRPILDKIIGKETHIVHLKVDRDHLFETAIAFYKTPSNVHKQLMITFQIMDVKDNDQLTDVIQSHPSAHAIDHIGWPTSRAITMNTRELLVQQLLQWELIDKRKSSLDSLKKGLNHMGFLKATKGNPNLLPLLVHTADYSINAKYVQTRLNKALDKLETKDNQQNEAKTFFTECLKTVTDQEACWLYEFITGSLDPTLEEEDIKLEFNTCKQTQILPESSTCATKLWIPLGNRTLPDFKKSFRTALENGRCGYGLD